jgi:hypothetical protein
MLTNILNNYVKSTTKVWKHDRSKTVGASEIGACERKVWYIKNAETHDKDHHDRWGATQRGNLIENHLVVPALRQHFGKKLLWAGDEQTTFTLKDLSATPDGLLTGLPRNALKHLGIKDLGADCILVEIKSIDPRANLDREKHQHRVQTITQLGLVRAKTAYKPNYALIVYIDASFHDEVSEFVIAFDEKVFALMQSRAAKILTAKAPQDLKPEGYIAGASECQTCPFKDPCGIERHTLPSEKFKAKPVDPQKVAEMTDLCRQALDREALADTYHAAFRETQEVIRARLRDWDVRRIPDVVTLSQVKGRETYDNEALRAAAAKAGVKVAKFLRIGEPTSRLTISLSDRSEN